MIAAAPALVLPHDVLLVVGALGLGALVPILWAIVDVARRPAWQFSAGRKAMWAITLGLGWVLVWPVALVSAIVYLTVLRRRFPTAVPQDGTPVRPLPVAGPHPALEPPRPLPRELPPAGWYPDPAGTPAERWWDGVGWSDHLR